MPDKDRLWEQAVKMVDAPENIDLGIGALILKGYVNPSSLVDGTLTLLDLNYIANLVKYKETVQGVYNKLVKREREASKQGAKNGVARHSF